MVCAIVGCVNIRISFLVICIAVCAGSRGETEKERIRMGPVYYA